jgi:hypothetical protein
MKRSLIALAVACAACGTAGVVQAAEEAGFEPIFNGRDLTGWEGNEEYWSVEDGAITARTTPENLLKYNTFLVWTEGKPADFELRLKYKIVGGNSGVQYRSRVVDEDRYVVSGYQADIDSTPRYSGILYEEKARGILAERGQKVVIGPDGKKQVETFADASELQQKIKKENWNDYRIVVRGDHLQHYINGVLMSETIDESGKGAESGIIALQAHQGPPMVVQFKEIRLKELK